MAKVRITWQRTCEYVADVDTAELRELLRAEAGSEYDAARAGLARLEAGEAWQYDDSDIRELAYVLNNTAAGRDYFGALADDNPGLCGGTGAPEVTIIEPAS